MLQNAPAHVKERCELLIYNFTVPLTVKNLLDLSKPDVAEISAWLDEQIINAEENFHCDIENALMPALDEMLAGKTAFYSDKESSQEFLHAICVQYMRTKKMRDRFAQITTAPVPGADMKRCGNLFTLAAAMRVADSLYQDREKFKIVLLDNDTASPFITGDQPVINIHATYGSGAPPERLELYYPLSPKKAMVLLELHTERSSKLTADEVQKFNDMIVWNSHEQVFSDSRPYLEGLQIAVEDTAK